MIAHNVQTKKDEALARSFAKFDQEHQKIKRITRSRAAAQEDAKRKVDERNGYSPDIVDLTADEPPPKKHKDQDDEEFMLAIAASISTAGFDLQEEEEREATQQVVADLLDANQSIAGDDGAPFGNRPDAQYRLTAIVAHKGGGARSGHYEADVWSMNTEEEVGGNDEPGGAGQWTTYSDEVATKTDEKKVFVSRRTNFTALFYTRM
jgi:hypothetical protein